MKKKSLKLQLNKEVISKLESSKIRGGAAGFTGGCTDGCSAFRHTELWNCSEDNCTNDCGHCGDPTWTGTANCPVLEPGPVGAGGGHVGPADVDPAG